MIVGSMERRGHDKIVFVKTEIHQGLVLCESQVLQVVRVAHILATDLQVALIPLPFLLALDSLANKSFNFPRRSLFDTFEQIRGTLPAVRARISACEDKRWTFLLGLEEVDCLKGLLRLHVEVILFFQQFLIRLEISPDLYCLSDRHIAGLVHVDHGLVGG